MPVIALPSKPNLDHLKYQAKDLLRDHGQRDLSGAADTRISPALRWRDRYRNLQCAPAPQRCATRHCARVRVFQLGWAETTHRKAYALRSTAFAAPRTD